MALSHSPRIITNGMMINYDFANFKSSKGQRSVIQWDTWVNGTTGSATGYSQNGDGNSRLYDANPFGDQYVVWDTSNQDITSDADGGWDTAPFSINSSKMYRYSTWVRRKTIGNGSFYLGPHSNWAATPGAYILNRSDSAENQNPYFLATNWWGNASQWYLVVGHVWPAGSGSGSTYPDTGVYDTSGTKIFNITDFMWAPANTTSLHRSYLYYSTDTATNQQWYQPRVDVCDGTEPSLADLLNNVGNRSLDLGMNGFNGNIIGAPKFQSDNNGTLLFNGLNDFIAIPSPSSRYDWTPSGAGNNFLTLEAWVKTSDTNGGFIFSKPWNGSGEYNYRVHPDAISLRVNTQSFTLLFPTITNNVWTHVVAVITPTQVGAYINGVLAAGFSNHGITQNIPQYGAVNIPLALMTLYPYGPDWAGNTGFSLAGSIGNFKIYNRALSADEVGQNFDAYRGRYGI